MCYTSPILNIPTAILKSLKAETPMAEAEFTRNGCWGEYSGAGT